MRLLARRIVEFLFPMVGFWLAQHDIARLESRTARPPVQGQITSELVAGIYAEELHRRQRLEDKLGGLLAYVTFLAPVAAGTAGIGLRDGNPWLISIGALAWVHLGSVFFLALFSSKSRAIWLVTVDLLGGLDGLNEEEAAARIDQERLASVEKNLPISWELNNALAAARGSVAWTVVLVSANVFLSFLR